MKFVFQATLFIVCINLGLYVTGGLGFFASSGIAPIFNPTQFQQQYNPQTTLSSWNSFGNIVIYIGDIVGGISFSLESNERNLLRFSFASFRDWSANSDFCCYRMLMGIPLCLVLY